MSYKPQHNVYIIPVLLTLYTTIPYFSSVSSTELKTVERWDHGLFGFASLGPSCPRGRIYAGEAHQI